ncbi:BTB/POZ/MATH-domain protein [Rhynchospora pubera]|uniref:BTB/POZ/MATH-domain protein n=1 Tax=Rhynchospora pubera TaxID=906938 RepID=A0AAV8DHG6_9POAL|nr:BTB/POZ/MATH-domain protein [Rhynchospora pubera]
MNSSETASAVRSEVESGSHQFMISGYSMTKGIGIENCVSSDVFTIGGYDWVIEFYPDGYNTENKNYISFFLLLESDVSDVKAKVNFTILQQNGVPSAMSCTTQQITFKSTSDSYFTSFGFLEFAKRSEFEASECLKDDIFTVKCIVTVTKSLQLTTSHGHGGTVPPSNLGQQLLRLLQRGDKADVTFVVKGEIFRAHRHILAARSAVFNAELFGCMREKWADTITIHDIEAPVFRSMLCFIYSDSLPNFEKKYSKDNDGAYDDMRVMAQHLLAAADRYDLERLKLMCEDYLCKNLNVSMVASTLIVAELHNCNQLKAECLRFMSSPVVFKAVAKTDGFLDLIKSFPSILKDI